MAAPEQDNQPASIEFHGGYQVYSESGVDLSPAPVRAAKVTVVSEDGNDGRASHALWNGWRARSNHPASDAKALGRRPQLSRHCKCMPLPRSM